MAWRDAMLLWDELLKYPPVRMTFAAFAGYKHEAPISVADISGTDLSFLQQAGGGLNKMPEHLKDAMRWAEGMKAKHGIN
jgi:hypothetical protein